MYYHWVFFFFIMFSVLSDTCGSGDMVYIKKRPNINIIGSLGNSFEKSKLLIFLLFDSKCLFNFLLSQ